MIQATDFVCPECKAQVAQPCHVMTPFWAYGRTGMRPEATRAKPHRVRLNLAKAKREQKGLK